MKNKYYILCLLQFSVLTCFAEATALQTQLMNIAAQEAEIAGIGTNKYMMLYGKDSPIPKIERWNEIQQRPALTVNQIQQINRLELTKKQLLQGTTNE